MGFFLILPWCYLGRYAFNIFVAELPPSELWMSPPSVNIYKVSENEVDSRLQLRAPNIPGRPLISPSLEASSSSRSRQPPFP